MSEEKKLSLSRRDFLRGLSAVAAGGVLAACVPAAPQQQGGGGGASQPEAASEEVESAPAAEGITVQYWVNWGWTVWYPNLGCPESV